MTDGKRLTYSISETADVEVTDPKAVIYAVTVEDVAQAWDDRWEDQQREGPDEGMPAIRGEWDTLAALDRRILILEAINGLDGSFHGLRENVDDSIDRGRRILSHLPDPDRRDANWYDWGAQLHWHIGAKMVIDEDDLEHYDDPKEEARVCYSGPCEVLRVQIAGEV